MSGDDLARLLVVVGSIVLVVSSLVGRKLPVSETLRYALSWCAIFSGVFVLFLFRAEFATIWARAKAELGGQSATMSGTTLSIPMAADGHFWVAVRIDGTQARFLIDSGATTTMIGRSLASRAGIEVDRNFPVSVETANGSISANAARVDTLDVGGIVQRDARALVSDNDVNVLGMSFLSGLKRWRVEGGNLYLEP